MVYHCKKSAPKENYLELKFCITGNAYCTGKNSQCGNCKNNLFKNCSNKTETIDVLSFRFSDIHLSQFAKLSKTNNTLADDILNFRHHSSFSKILNICSRSSMVLEALLNNTYTDSLENIYIQSRKRRCCYYTASSVCLVIKM